MIVVPAGVEHRPVAGAGGLGDAPGAKGHEQYGERQERADGRGIGVGVNQARNSGATKQAR